MSADERWVDVPGHPKYEVYTGELTRRQRRDVVDAATVVLEQAS